jgi:hypothetical protein
MDEIKRIEASVNMNLVNPYNTDMEDYYLRDCKTLLTALAQEREAYETLTGLLKKRFPRNPDGSLPDYKVEDVLRENVTLKERLAGVEAIAMSGEWLHESQIDFNSSPFMALASRNATYHVWPNGTRSYKISLTACDPK